MKRTLALVLTVVIAMPVVSLAQLLEGAILQSAERAAAGLALQSEASGNRRSRGRTWAGLVMIATGAALASATRRTVTRSGGVLVSETKDWYEPIAYPGIGVAVTGVLLATISSDVPANSQVDFAVTPGRVRVGKTFGF
jgi:hypothetical protein